MGSNAEATVQAALTLQNERLKSELSARAAELRDCRARALEATAAVRRRIERNLHDGVQQRLVSVAMSLGLLAATLPADPEAALPIAREACEGLELALDELRELSDGVYPSVLTERGLPHALAELCRRSALPARLEISLESRPPAAVEAAAYFIVSETLTNAVKHSRASEVRVGVSREEQLLCVAVARSASPK
jgi:signal transduction histidine kinase